MPEYESVHGNVVRDDIENHSRRRAVKKITIGVGTIAAYHALPVRWSKPFIDSVLLPAHAATSGDLSADCSTCIDDCNITEVLVDPTIVIIRVSTFLGPEFEGAEITGVATFYEVGGNITSDALTMIAGPRGGFTAFASFPPGIVTKVKFRMTSPAKTGTGVCVYVTPSFAGGALPLQERGGGERVQPRFYFEE